VPKLSTEDLRRGRAAFGQRRREVAGTDLTPNSKRAYIEPAYKLVPWPDNDLDPVSSSCIRKTDGPDFGLLLS